MGAAVSRRSQGGHGTGPAPGPVALALMLLHMLLTSHEKSMAMTVVQFGATDTSEFVRRMIHEPVFTDRCGEDALCRKGVIWIFV